MVGGEGRALGEMEKLGQAVQEVVTEWLLLNNLEGSLRQRWPGSCSALPHAGKVFSTAPAL